MIHPGPEVSLQLGRVQIQWIDTSAHYPGDTMILLPPFSVVFTGDLVRTNMTRVFLDFESNP
ncbi:MAG: hypothetical protein ACOVN3_04520 [Limnohabitans sp.]